MEVRLNKRQKMKQLFKLLGVKSNLTFKKLFKPAISKKILLHYLDELENKRPVLLDYKAQNDNALLAALMFHNPECSTKLILQMFGLKKMLETVTIRELRAIFSNYNKRSWYRLITDARKIKLPSQSPFGAIRKNLINFKPLQLFYDKH
ncbi:hypothetical protein E3J79_00600 [Candidatus Dependentiae bacterium]|nr:MAG: hypothetical protein E3J79_00600 [Candidatus Dependentiae bacterium]